MEPTKESVVRSGITTVCFASFFVLSLVRSLFRLQQWLFGVWVGEWGLNGALLKSGRGRAIDGFVRVGIDILRPKASNLRRKICHSDKMRACGLAGVERDSKCRRRTIPDSFGSRPEARDLRPY